MFHNKIMCHIINDVVLSSTRKNFLNKQNFIDSD